MKNETISIAVLLVASILCFAQSPNDTASRDEADFEKYDKQMLESLRDKMKEEFLRGSSLKEYDAIPKDKKEQALQKYVETYVRKNQMAKAEVEKKNKSLSLFGQVLDQSGKPIEKATVVMSVTSDRMVGKKFLIQQSIKTECRATTDKTGSFGITNVIGWMFTLEYIKADDYSFNKNDQPSVYFHPATQETQLKQPGYFLQDKEHPITLRIVKKDR